jgi:hypothetical protein
MENTARARHTKRAPGPTRSSSTGWPGPSTQYENLAMTAAGPVVTDPGDGHRCTQRLPAPQPDPAAQHTPAQPRCAQLGQYVTQAQRPGLHRYPRGVHGDGSSQACTSNAANAASRAGWRGLAQLHERHRAWKTPASSTSSGPTSSRSDDWRPSAAEPGSPALAQARPCSHRPAGSSARRRCRSKLRTAATARKMTSPHCMSTLPIPEATHRHAYSGYPSTARSLDSVHRYPASWAPRIPVDVRGMACDRSLAATQEIPAQACSRTARR